MIYYNLTSLQTETVEEPVEEEEPSEEEPKEEGEEEDDATVEEEEEKPKTKKVGGASCSGCGFISVVDEDIIKGRRRERACNYVTHQNSNRVYI